SLTIDLFGFSRGAASARHAAYEINRGLDGALGRVLLKNGIGWPKRVVIRFVGLFDTVSAVINPAELDLSPSNDRNDPVDVYLAPESVKYAVHLVAADEFRENFALNSLRNANGEIPKNFREIVLPGAHSDVGGGYPDILREDLIISKYHKIDNDRIDWPDQTMQWDNLEELRRVKTSEGWIGDFSLPVRSSEYHDPNPEDLGPFGDASLSIYKIESEHPAPRGRIELALRMVRNIRGEYSRIALHLMRTLAVQMGVPFQDLDFDSAVGRLPDDLIAISGEMMEQVVAGEDKIQLRADQGKMIRQRYTHHSANYDPLKFLLKSALFQLRLGRNFSPNAPVSSGERIIHPNR
ncbi:MAG: DUF2235 domain-containing protein, partial [Marinobacter sp.]